jgi:hypothetical protein
MTLTLTAIGVLFAVVAAWVMGYCAGVSFAQKNPKYLGLQPADPPNVDPKPAKAKTLGTGPKVLYQT